MKKTLTSVLIYSFLCLILILLYRFQTGIFEPVIMNYNLSLWSALIVNIIFLILCIISLKENKIIPTLGIILCFPSTYFFYLSWTLADYSYLAYFVLIPIFLLILTLSKSIKMKSF